MIDNAYAGSGSLSNISWSTLLFGLVSVSLAAGCGVVASIDIFYNVHLMQELVNTHSAAI